MAATRKPKRPTGRPPGKANRITEEVGGILDDTKALLSRDLLRQVIEAGGDLKRCPLAKKHPADAKLAAVLVACAFKSMNDPRYLVALKALEERLWGRVKEELEHQGAIEHVFRLVEKRP